MAKVIEETQRPAIIMAHNKTLAAQLYGEFRDFFPNNSVEYFVSYYDYYQPEAYVPASDTYIAKDASINEHIDHLQHQKKERRKSIDLAKQLILNSFINEILEEIQNIEIQKDLKETLDNYMVL